MHNHLIQKYQSRLSDLCSRFIIPSPPGQSAKSLITQSPITFFSNYNKKTTTKQKRSFIPSRNCV